MTETPLRYRLYFNFAHESNEYGPYPMQYYQDSYFIKKINGAMVPNCSYYLDSKTTSEIQALYFNHKITMNTRFSIQSIPNDSKYDLLTTDKNDPAVQFVERDTLFADFEGAYKYSFIEDCLISAEISKHCNVDINFVANPKIWTLIITLFSLFFIADHIIIIFIKVSWCFTSYWFLAFIDIILILVAWILFYKFDSVNIFSLPSYTFVAYLSIFYNLIFDASEGFYGYLLCSVEAFNVAVKKLMRSTYFQNSCATFINQNDFIRNEQKEYDSQIIAFLKNVNHHILNMMSLYLSNMHVQKLRNKENNNVLTTEEQEKVDEWESDIQLKLKKFQNCLLHSHQTTHQIFAKCQCEEHTFDYRKDAYIKCLNGLYFNSIYLRYFALIFLIYGSFYGVAFFIESHMEVVYVRLFIDFVIVSAYFLLIYGQYYYLQLQSLKKMDMYWRDPQFLKIVNESDNSLHFTLNGYCQYIQHTMCKYYICCLLYGLKMHNAKSLIALISFNSIDTITQYLCDDEDFELSNDCEDLQVIAENIQNTQTKIVQQLQRINNTLATDHFVIVYTESDEAKANSEGIMSATHTAAGKEKVHIIIKKEDLKEEDAAPTLHSAVPTITHFQRAAFNINRFNFNPNVDPKAVFKTLQQIIYTAQGKPLILELNDAFLKEKLFCFEGTMEFLRLLGFDLVHLECEDFGMYCEAAISVQMATNAIYGLNGFVEPPLVFGLEPDIEIDQETQTKRLLFRWEFASPDTKVHTVSLRHVQHANNIKRQIVSVDGCEYYNEQSSVSSFNIEIGRIMVNITMEKLDPMWSSQQYKYKFGLDQQRYMEVFALWKSQLFASMVDSMPSIERVREFHAKLIFHREEYNKMVGLNISPDTDETMKHHLEEYKQARCEYLDKVRLMRYVDKPECDFRETALTVYGFVRIYGGIVPLKAQNIGIIIMYVAPQYQVTFTPSICSVLNDLQI